MYEILRNILSASSGAVVGLIIVNLIELWDSKRKLRPYSKKIRKILLIALISCILIFIVSALLLLKFY